MKLAKKPELFIHETKGSSLGKINNQEVTENIESEKEGKKNKAVTLSIPLILIFALFIVVGVGGYYYVQTNLGGPKSRTLTNDDPYFLSELAVTSTTTTTPKPTTTSITTTTTTPEFTTIITTTTSTPEPAATTTTTILECGGDLEPPCENIQENDGCDKGNVIGSEGICHTPECAPSIPSGKKGCGAWALNYCKGKK